MSHPDRNFFSRSVRLNNSGHRRHPSRGDIGYWNLSAYNQGMMGYPDGMLELNHVVGEILDKIDELGIADNTIVIFSSDNGAQKMTWPDGGQSPFRGEKATWWKGGFRVPLFVRWPGVFKPCRYPHLGLNF